MAKAKETKKSSASTSSFTLTVARTGERPIEVALRSGATAEDAVKAAGISMRTGEVLERDGKVIELGDKVNKGDVIFVTEDDENG